MWDWLIAILAYLILLGGMATVAVLRRPASRVDPRAYETHDPELSDLLDDMRVRRSLREW